MPYAPVRILGIYLIALAAGVCSWSAACTAATFELARRTDGTIVRGVKLEGEIVPGDAQKLLELYNAYAEMVSPIYLRSKGGNVDEAMKIGTIIRRLRLETRAPIVLDAGGQPTDFIKIDHQENMVRASTCFLVYAGGASRFGNYLALHRPYLPKEEARKINDAEYEAFHKQILPKVKDYLTDMEIDQYWIDRMFAASSQESYMPTREEVDSQLHHLTGFVPSLEEVVLSKCNQDPLSNASGSLSADDKHKLVENAKIFYQCQDTALSDMQRAAFERENDATLKEKCEQLPSLTGTELLTLKALLAKGTNVTPEEDQRRLQLFSKQHPREQCRREEAYSLHFAAITRWSNEIKKGERIAADIACPDDFKAKDLSAVAMAKRGKNAYDAENYLAAKNCFQKAAALGNAEAMLGISWLYGTGHGVPKDESEALRWRRRSADNGNTDAMSSIGYAYEKGETVSQDYAEALRWFRKAADLGDSFASYFIGMHYLFAWGVPKDESKAREWIKKAAALGNTVASSWLIDNP